MLCCHTLYNGMKPLPSGCTKVASLKLAKPFRVDSSYDYTPLVSIQVLPMQLWRSMEGVFF